MARQEINGRPIIWRPQPRQAAFMRRSEDEALYGGAAGGGEGGRGGDGRAPGADADLRGHLGRRCGGGGCRGEGAAVDWDRVTGDEPS